ncbi:MAG: glycosyltransferase family 2 protein [Tannerella sp.]|jgi:glycosyltransferase involved in cell wall biosynthesis|nr:glycosyltransferase family 2 protein [Tannerella sp.]
MKISVFTPTFNRGYLLKNLYDSLVRQTYKGFEWIIVDDGSEDDTEKVCTGFIDKNIIDIKYIRQKNGGKHRALNNAAKKAQGELFFVVDSDDQLTANALERIAFHYNRVKDDESIGGVFGVKALFSGKPPGDTLLFPELKCNNLDFRYKMNFKGDMAEIFRTSVIREFPFPEYENERFCPEALVWNRIGRSYNLFIFNEIIYLCDYLDDGLTRKIVKIRMESPRASMDTYAELCHSPVPWLQKIKARINFWRFSFNSDIPFTKKMKRVSGFYNLLAIPLGYLMHINDKKTVLNQNG